MVKLDALAATELPTARIRKTYLLVCGFMRASHHKKPQQEKHVATRVSSGLLIECCGTAKIQQKDHAIVFVIFKF